MSKTPKVALTKVAPAVMSNFAVVMAEANAGDKRTELTAFIAGLSDQDLFLMHKTLYRLRNTMIKEAVFRRDNKPLSMEMAEVAARKHMNAVNEQ